MMATAANIIGPVLSGRPIPWLILQILAVATVAVTLATAAAWRRHHRNLTRPPCADRPARRRRPAVPTLGSLLEPAHTVTLQA